MQKERDGRREGEAPVWERCYLEKESGEHEERIRVSTFWGVAMEQESGMINTADDLKREARKSTWCGHDWPIVLLGTDLNVCLTGRCEKTSTPCRLPGCTTVTTRSRLYLLTLLLSASSLGSDHRNQMRIQPPPNVGHCSSKRHALIRIRFSHCSGRLTCHRNSTNAKTRHISRALLESVSRVGNRTPRAPNVIESTGHPGPSILFSDNTA